MPRYHVHVVTSVRVRIANIQADSPLEAARQAERLVYDPHSPIDFHSILSRAYCPRDNAVGLIATDTEWNEDATDFLVDQDGDTEYMKSEWYSPEELGTDHLMS